MGEELLTLICTMEKAKQLIQQLVFDQTDPYALSNARKIIGSVETECIVSKHKIDDTIKRLGYTWENTYSPEARRVAHNKAS